MENKIFKIAVAIFIALTSCLNLNAQVKTKVFYSNIPSKYNSLKAVTLKTHTIEAPEEFYTLKNKKKVDEEIKFAFQINTNIDFLKEATLEKIVEC